MMHVFMRCYLEIVYVNKTLKPGGERMSKEGVCEWFYTYGWSIIILIIVGSALYAEGQDAFLLVFLIPMLICIIGLLVRRLFNLQRRYSKLKAFKEAGNV